MHIISIIYQKNKQTENSDYYETKCAVLKCDAKLKDIKIFILYSMKHR